MVNQVTGKQVINKQGLGNQGSGIREPGAYVTKQLSSELRGEKNTWFAFGQPLAKFFTPFGGSE
jgi:hypothetical protein